MSSDPVVAGCSRECTHRTAILLRGSVGWHRGDVVGLAHLSGDHLRQEHLSNDKCELASGLENWEIIG